MDHYSETLYEANYGYLADPQCQCPITTCSASESNVHRLISSAISPILSYLTLYDRFSSVGGAADGSS